MITSFAITDEFLHKFWSMYTIGPIPEHRPELGPCWIAGPGNSEGYRPIQHDGRVFRAHRVSLMLKLGRDLLPGMFAMHKCDVRLCINPDHLEEGNGSDNSQDCVKKRRRNKGRKNTTDEIVELVTMKQSGASWKDIMRRLGRTGDSTRHLWRRYKHTALVASPSLFD